MLEPVYAQLPLAEVTDARRGADVLLGDEARIVLGASGCALVLANRRSVWSRMLRKNSWKEIGWINTCEHLLLLELLTEGVRLRVRFVAVEHPWMSKSGRILLQVSIWAPRDALYRRLASGSRTKST